VKRTTRIGMAVAGCLTAAVAIGPAVGSSPAAVRATPAPLTIVYDTTPTTHQLVFPPLGPAEPGTRALRQDPGGWHVRLGDNSPFRISR